MQLAFKGAEMRQPHAMAGRLRAIAFSAVVLADGGSSLANRGNFYELRQCSHGNWQSARKRIEAQNAKDRSQGG